MVWSILYRVMKREWTVNRTKLIALKDGDLRMGKREDLKVGKK